MDAPRFRTIRKSLAPSWLTSGEGELVGYALDILKDCYFERARLGLLARFPQQDPTGTPAPDDALSAMGRDRRIVRGINESQASYALRLLAWLDDRKTAGGAYALLQQLVNFIGKGTACRTVDNAGNWYTIAADGTRSTNIKAANWNWDSQPTLWSRFWVVIYPPAGLWTLDTWGAGTWGDGGLWGDDETSDQLASIRAIIADWKPAGSTCAGIIVTFDPTLFSPMASSGLPDGTWNHWGKVSAGVEVLNRAASTLYQDGS